jgi:hypothetical protein
MGHPTQEWGIRGVEMQSSPFLPQFHDLQGFIPTSSMTSVTFNWWFPGVICTS